MRDTEMEQSTRDWLDSLPLLLSKVGREVLTKACIEREKQIRKECASLERESK